MSAQDKDLVFGANYLRFMIWLFLPCLLLATLLIMIWRTDGQISGQWGELVLSAFIALIPALILDALASFLAVILFHQSVGALIDVFHGRRSWRSVREQLEADVSVIKQSVRQGDYVQALTLANQILEKDPDHPEVLALKAQILWQGFRRSRDAWLTLRRIMEKVPEGDPVRRWAADYYQEVTGNLEEEEPLPRPGTTPKPEADHEP
ncbi:MAG: tetratricopeptide repeat protein [Thermodesulfobacteriota bacterium]